MRAVEGSLSLSEDEESFGARISVWSNADDLPSFIPLSVCVSKKKKKKYRAVTHSFRSSSGWLGLIALLLKQMFWHNTALQNRKKTNGYE